MEIKSDMKFPPTPVSIVLPNLRSHNKQLKALSMVYIAKLLEKIIVHQEDFDIHDNLNIEASKCIETLNWFMSYKLLIRNCCEKLLYSFESNDLYESLVSHLKCQNNLKNNIKELARKCHEIDFNMMRVNAIKSVSEFRKYPFLNSMINTNEVLFSNVANLYEKASERRLIQNPKLPRISTKVPLKFKNCFILINPSNCKLAPLEKINEDPIFCAVFPDT